MTPDFICTIEAESALVTQSAVTQFCETLTARLPALDPYKGALVDVVNTKTSDDIEIYNVPDMDGDFVSSTNGTRLLWMPAIGRAALNSYQAGDWQWTDAASPEEALRRYRDDDMSP